MRLENIKAIDSKSLLELEEIRQEETVDKDEERSYQRVFRSHRPISLYIITAIALGFLGVSSIIVDRNLSEYDKRLHTICDGLFYFGFAVGQLTLLWALIIICIPGDELYVLSKSVVLVGSSGYAKKIIRSKDGPFDVKIESCFTIGPEEGCVIVYTNNKDYDLGSYREAHEVLKCIVPTLSRK